MTQVGYREWSDDPPVSFCYGNKKFFEEEYGNF